MLVFVRHGVRGIGNSNILLAEGENLSLYGHIYSYKLGKYIRREYGKIDVIYPDNNTERTIATGIAIAKGNGRKEIFMSEKKPDPFFCIGAEERDIFKIRKRLIEKKKEIEELGRDLGLKGESWIDSNDEKIEVKGLLNEISELVNIPSFSILSKTKTNIPKSVENCFMIKERILYTDVVNEKGKELMNGVVQLLKKNKLSVLIGHDESNIALLSLYFSKTFFVDGYSPGYIPANSGFIFTLHESTIRIEIIYLTLQGKFKVKSYKNFDSGGMGEGCKFDFKKYKI